MGSLIINLFSLSEGNPNIIQNIKHEERHLKWHFVYFGYSRIERKAFAYVQFASG